MSQFPVQDRNDPVSSASDQTNVVAMPPQDSPAARPGSVLEQLARLEEKTARIEEKLARSEASTARVIDRLEMSSHKVGEIAQQTEVVAIRSDTKFIARRLKTMPTFYALITACMITAVLTSGLTALIFRFLLGR